MTEAFKLKDGSLSIDYRAGDTFIFSLNDKSRPRIIEITTPDFSMESVRATGTNGMFSWKYLTPTEETRRRVLSRKSKLNPDAMRASAEVPQSGAISRIPLARFVDWTKLTNALSDALYNQREAAKQGFQYDSLDEHIDSLLDLQYVIIAPLDGVEMTRGEIEGLLGVRIKED